MGRAPGIVEALEAHERAATKEPVEALAEVHDYVLNTRNGQFEAVPKPDNHAPTTKSAPQPKRPTVSRPAPVQAARYYTD